MPVSRQAYHAMLCKSDNVIGFCWLPNCLSKSNEQKVNGASFAEQQQGHSSGYAVIWLI